MDFLQAAPLTGATEVLHALKDKGFRLAIVTTRSTEHREHTMAWVDKWLPGVFESIHFTGDFSTGQEGRERLTKGEICRKLSASLLIDDSVENVLACVNTQPRPTPALLFGDYEWNKRASTAVTDEDRMSFEERRHHETTAGRSAVWWQEESIDLPEGVWRVKDWPGVLAWMAGVGKEAMNTINV